MSVLNFIPPSRAGASAIKMDRWQKGWRKAWEEVEEEDDEEVEKERTAVSGFSESAALFREAHRLLGRRKTRLCRCTDVRFFFFFFFIPKPHYR